MNTNSIEAAYRRTNLFERPRDLMEQWAAFLGRTRRLVTPRWDPESHMNGVSGLVCDQPVVKADLIHRALLGTLGASRGAARISNL